MNYFKGELSKMEIQRKSIVRTNQKESRLSKINYSEWKPKSPDAMKDRAISMIESLDMKNFGDQSPNSTKLKFKNLVRRGLLVEDYTPFGSQEQIELETLKLLRDQRKRFNKSTATRTEFIASNYLSDMLSEEELMLKNRLAQEEAMK